MSLFKQLLVAICLFLVVAFSGSFMVSLESSRRQYVNQLQSHAQDAATALALSLTPNIDDPAMVELMVSSIFDSGYYASIRVVDLATETVLVERSAEPDASGVPAWFVKLINLRPAGGDAIVSRGWQQAARVEVVSHPLFAVAKLWKSALVSLGWLLLCGAVSALLGAMLLRRQLKPLDLDGLTGLGNRRYFEMQLNAHVSHHDEARDGFLLLLRINDLAGLNQRLGGQRTDALIQAVGQQLLRTCANYPQTSHLITRSRGDEFAVLAPELVREEALQWAQALESSLLDLQASGVSDTIPIAYIGLAPFSPGDAPQALLALADEALSKAQAQQDGHWVCIERSDAPTFKGDHHDWR